MKRRSPAARGFAVVGTALLLALSACAPGGSPDRPADRPAGEIRTDAASLGEVTLTVWDQETRAGQEEQITRLNEQFQRTYPNIRINRVARSFDDLRNTVKLGLSGNEAPDIAQVNNGKQDMGAFVKAGLLVPLDGYAQAYGWATRYPEAVRRLASYPDGGDTLGEGKLYGVPQTGELVGLFYNKTKLAELGLTPPADWAAFDAALAKAKGAGQLPIQFGNLEKSAGPYLFGLAMHRHSRPAEETALATGRQEATWPTDANRAAARQVLDWANQGYLTPGFAGLKNDDSWANFAKGEGVFHLNGTWLTPDLKAAMGDSVGFLRPPGASITGGTGVPWAISSKSKNPDAAAAYLNFITSPEAMKVLGETANLPVLDAGSQPATGVQKEVLDAWQAASTSAGLVPYLDYATPNAYEVVSGAVEQLLSGAADPEKFLGTLQADLDASRGGR